MYYSYVEIKYVATSISPVRTNLALRLFNCYFLCLVFLHNCYLLISSHLSRLRRNPISHPIFSYLWFSEYLVVHAPPTFLAHMALFLKARRSWEPGRRIWTSILSPFRFLPKVSHANVRRAIASHTFSSHINPWTDTFLRDISLR
jgi:hypothetical protein